MSKTFSKRDKKRKTFSKRVRKPSTEQLKKIKIRKKVHQICKTVQYMLENGE